MAGRYCCFSERPEIPEFGNQIGFDCPDAIYINYTLPDFHHIARNTQHSLNERFASIPGVPEDDYVAPLHIPEPVDKTIDEYPFLIQKPGLHTCTLDFDRLDDKNDNKDGYGESKENIAEPGFQFEYRSETLILGLVFRLRRIPVIHRQTQFSLNPQNRNLKLPDRGAKLKWFVAEMNAISDKKEIKRDVEFQRDPSH
jgi:hypothetical protein